MTTPAPSAPPTTAARPSPHRPPSRPPAGASLLEVFDRTMTVRVRFAFPTGDHDVGRNAADPGSSEPAYVLRVRDEKLLVRIAGEGSLGLAESYMDGGWDLEHGSLEGFLRELLTANLLRAIHQSPALALRLGLLRLRQRLLGTRVNSQAHYDIGEDLYAAFLDETRGYTCGYQKTPQDDSRTLQENKYDRICRKLRLSHGDTLYDLGCGYGGLLIFAAQNYGVRGTGITNSVNHGTYAGQRAKQIGIADRVTIHIGDFSEAQGTHDRVVSVGCLEHLFRSEHERFFSTVRRLMAPGGYGLIHTIGTTAAKNTPDPFIQKYIFPGSTQNPLSTIVGWCERKKLAVLDVENVGRHYYYTSMAWLNAFRSNRHTLDRTRYDDRFLRMWDLYLSACTAASAVSDGAVFQVVVTNTYRRMLPLHRIGV